MKLFYTTLVAISLATLSSCTKDIGANPDLLPKTAEYCDTITFTKHIEPIFVNQCANCHSPTTSNQFPPLTNYAEIKTQVDGGRIKARVLDQNPSPMPQGASLTQPELDLVKCWLDAGAPNN